MMDCPFLSKDQNDWTTRASPWAKYTRSSNEGSRLSSSMTAANRNQRLWIKRKSLYYLCNVVEVIQIWIILQMNSFATSSVGLSLLSTWASKLAINNEKQVGWPSNFNNSGLGKPYSKGWNAGLYACGCQSRCSRWTLGASRCSGWLRRAFVCHVTKYNRHKLTSITWRRRPRLHVFTPFTY